MPETALWNLFQRASAARSGHLNDLRAVEVLEGLDYPFERFESPYGGLAARLHARRVRTMDDALRKILANASSATVVALGEGFETQFWRVDDGRLRWVSVDLPEVAAVRRVVLPDGARCRTLTGSAADLEWIDSVDRERPVVITAQGLLPYFTREEVHGLFASWAQQLSGAWLLFDAVTPDLQAVRNTHSLPNGYQPPEWCWTVDREELRELRELPGVGNLHEVPQARGDWLLAVLRSAPGMRGRIPTVPAYQVQLGLDGG